MKITIRIAAFVLVLGVGFAIGLYYGSRYGEAPSFPFDMVETAYYGAFMEMQMAEGTDATREEAIRGFLALNEKRRQHPNEIFTEKVLSLDAALANARLAALALKRGAAQEAQQYLSHAEQFCPQIGWKECSADKFSQMVQRLDKQGIFGQRSKE